MDQDKTSNGHLRNDEGSVLLTVLLLLFLLTAITLSFSLTIRSSSRTVANTVDNIRGEQLVKSGIALAVFHLESSEDLAHQFSIEEVVASLGHVEIFFEDEEGKVDINAASPELLRFLFEAFGDVNSEMTVARIQDYRDADDDARVGGAELDDYTVAGKRYGPKNRAFESLNELYQIPGLSRLETITPYLTIYTRRSGVDFTRSPNGFLDKFVNSSVNFDNIQLYSQNSSRRIYRASVKGVTLGGTIVSKDVILFKGNKAILIPY